MARRKEILILLLCFFAGCCNCSCGGGGETEPETKPEPSAAVTLPVDGFLAIVEDPAERSVDLSILFASSFWLEEIEAHGYNRPLIYDSNSERGRELMQETDSALPSVFFLDDGGSVLASAPVPKPDIENGLKRLLNGGIRQD
jgi:hypothetical protein